MEVDAAVVLWPRPVPVLRHEHVQLVAACSYGPGDGVDEGRDAIARKARVRRRDGEDSQELVRSAQDGFDHPCRALPFVDPLLVL